MHGPKLMRLIFAVLYVHDHDGPLHAIIKRQFCLHLYHIIMKVNSKTD